MLLPRTQPSCLQAQSSILPYLVLTLALICTNALTLALALPLTLIWLVLANACVVLCVIVLFAVLALDLTLPCDHTCLNTNNQYQFCIGRPSCPSVKL